MVEEWIATMLLWHWFQLFSTLEMEDGPIIGTNMTMRKMMTIFALQ